MRGMYNIKKSQLGPHVTRGYEYKFYMKTDSENGQLNHRSIRHGTVHRLKFVAGYEMFCNVSVFSA